MRRNTKRGIAALSLSLMLGSCASVDAPPLKPGQKPTDDKTEAGMWLQVEKFEDDVATSALRVNDPELVNYVESLVCRISGPYCSDIRVYVLDVPAFNASMMPNGTMMIWTGLLLRAENEAQASFVIGHELAHYIERHSLERHRTIQNNANAALIFGMMAGAGGIPELATIGNMAALSNIFGFSRENEREADKQGYDTFVARGYDGKQAAGIWRALMAEVDESDFEKKKKRSCTRRCI